MTGDAVRLPNGAATNLRLLSAAQTWSGVLAPATIVIATLLASLFATQYSHLDDSICQLGAQDRPQAWIMSLGFLIYAGFVALFALQLKRELDSSWGRAASKALLLTAAYASLLAFVQANPKISGAEHNTEGAVHIFLARGSLIFLWLAMLAVAKHYWLTGRDALSTYSAVAIVVGVALSAAYIAQIAVEIDGVFERIMLLGVTGWFVALSLRLRRDRLGRAADDNLAVADLGTREVLVQLQGARVVAEKDTEDGIGDEAGHVAHVH
jgi:hypothetical membrane protein